MSNAFSNSSWLWLRRALFVALLTLAGCYGTTSAYVVADAPVGVEAYPSSYYDGRVVYWVGDRWYARDGDTWFYYRSEPTHLYDYRARWRGYSAPAPPRYYRPYHGGAPRYRRSAPPARYAAPPVRNAAPPARHSAPRSHHRR